ncbi:MAG: hypothetical protein K2N90_03630, partial [Lachnospiraceae bacterium]|nr:hypothetical protein [Lachnospiraceae bacterium]
MYVDPLLSFQVAILTTCFFALIFICKTHGKLSIRQLAVSGQIDHLLNIRFCIAQSGRKETL